MKNVFEATGSTIEGFTEDYDRKKDGGVLVIPEGTTEIEDYAFEGEKDIKTVLFPSTLKRIGQYAFWICPNLKTIVFESSDVTIEEGAFEKCTSLKHVIHDAAFKQLWPAAFGGCFNLADKDGFVIVDNVLFDYLAYDLSPTVPEGVEIISKPGFSGHRPLESIQLPSTLVAIGEDAFKNCYFLSKVNIPKNTKYIDKCAFDVMYGSPWNDLPYNLFQNISEEDVCSFISPFTDDYPEYLFSCLERAEAEM